MAHCFSAQRCELARFGCAPALRGGAVMLLVLAIAAPVRAQPSVRVRAATRLELEAVPSEHGLRLQGALLDDLGQALSSRPIELLLETEAGAKQQRTRQTDEEGKFRALFTLPPGRYRALARFAGDVAYAGGEERRELDAGKADVRLRFIEPRELRLDLDAPRHAIAVRASSSVGSSRLEIRVQDERGRELLRAQSGDDGVVRAELPSAALGPAGVGRLIAHSAGDAQRSAAQSEIEVLPFERSAITLRARLDPRSGRLALDGTLRAGQRGLGEKAVGVFDGAQHVITLRTAADGSFVYSGALPKQASTGPQALRLQARFDNDAPEIGASRSRVVELRLAGAGGLSVLWLCAPLAACALALWLLSRREIQALRRHSAAPPARGAGIQLALRGARGQVEPRRISGSVRDAASHQPIAEASIVLQPAGGQRIDLATDEGGRFVSPELPVGDFTLQVHAPDYLPIESTLHVPHRGEWSDVQVSLTSLRDAAVAVYRPVAARALPSLDLWERWTARETLESAMRAGRAHASLALLTEHVERAAYAKSPPNAADLATIERTADAALAEMPEVANSDQQSHSRNSARLRARIPHHR